MFVWYVFFQGYGNMKMYAYMYFSAFVDSNLLFFQLISTPHIQVGNNKLVHPEKAYMNTYNVIHWHAFIIFQ